MLAQLKSFAQAFSKACSFQRQSLWSLSAESDFWAKPNTCFFSAADFIRRLFFFQQL
jgi:hypothetical protein